MTRSASDAAPARALPEAPWASTAERVLAELDVDPARGLPAAEVHRRRSLHGPNRLREMARRSVWAVLVAQFASLIVALLAVAAVVAFAFGETVEAAAIVAVIVVNGAIGFVMELRAVRSMEALRELGRAEATVRRDGAAQHVPAERLVPGDVVMLEAGDVVTADLRLVEASKLQANESTLTGESAPVDKRVAPTPTDAPLAERASMFFKGTAVTRGSGAGVVVATGMATELGHVSSLVDTARAETTPLEKRLDALGRRLVVVTLAVAALVAASGLASDRDLLLVIEIALALAVATVPEGLPIVATIALARGMWRMARRNALVEQLAAVETLGSTSIILTDKTGTLTENRMTLATLEIDGGPVEISGTGLAMRGTFTRDGVAVAPDEEPALAAALEVGALCNNASLRARGGDDADALAVGDPMEVALLVAAAKAGLDAERLRREWPELREVAFDPDQKMMATFHGDGDGGIRVAVKGAPEAVLDASTRVRTQDGARPLDDEPRAHWRRRVSALAEAGMRLLALAEREAASADEDPYRELTWLGLAALLDPPRERVREALAGCASAGIRVVMLTGDHASTARTVAKALGLLDARTDRPETVLDGRELAPPGELDERDAERLLAARIVARATPQQKLDLIALHQSRGAVVAMTGDGVNDAPALRKADIGVAMGRRGTQVAKEAADMVLQDDEFSTIVAAIEQGRAIFGNIRKFALYLLSCNMSEILVVGLASVANAPLPLLPLQILFLNLVTDVFPALALGVGEGGPGLMERRPRPPGEPILAGRHWRAIAGHGAVITLAVLGALALAIRQLGMDPERAVTVSFLTLALAQLWHVFNMRERDSHWLRNEITRNPWVWAALALCVALLLAAVYVPGLSHLLQLADPGPRGWALVLAASVVPLLLGPLVRRLAGGPEAPPEAAARAAAAPLAD